MPPTASEIVAAIDQAILDLTVNGASEVQVTGRIFRAHNLSTLKETRAYYAGLAAEEARASAGGVLGTARGGIPFRG